MIFRRNEKTYLRTDLLDTLCAQMDMSGTVMFDSMFDSKIMCF